MPTIYDIARKADVSPASVSRVLNNRSGVKPETSQRIRRVMEEMDFQPRWKAMDRNRFLVLLPNYKGVLNSGYVTRILSGITDTAFRLGFNVVLRPFDSHQCNYRELRQLIAQDGAAGCLIISLNESYLPPADLKQMGLPHVVLGYKQENDGTHQVLLHAQKTGMEATEYLQSLGHRKIAIVTFQTTDSYQREVYEGYVEVMRKAGLESEIRHIQFNNDMKESGRSAALQLLSPLERPTAVIVTNENLASGFFMETKNMGLSIPKDLSIIAFECSDVLCMAEPALTVMHSPLEMYGEESVKMLLALVEADKKNTDVAKTKYIDTPLIVRRSTAMLAKG